MFEPVIHPTSASTLSRLSRSWLEQAGSLPSGLLSGPLAIWPERVIQFGEGNFLRAFADWMIDVLNERGLFGGSIVVVPPTRRGRADVLNAQNGLYTVLLRGVQDGRIQEQRRVITAVSRALNAYESWDELVRCFSKPEMRIAISNTTETGIAFLEEARHPDRCPESFPAKVTSLLYERFLALGGKPTSGLIFLPCELIERNGATLRELVLQHAKNWKLGRPFADWVTDCNHFLNTLVDRIVPGHPRDEAPQFTRELGYEDALLVAAEWFHLWIIEGPMHLAEELPFHRAALNVVWTKDLGPHRTRKVRILNGAHTACALAAFLGGLNLVREMMEDAAFGSFVRRAVFDEIVPSLAGNLQEATTYAQAVLERFQNPFVRHELLSISLNSVAKWKVRVLPSLLDCAASLDSLPPLLCFSLAALIHFYRGERTSAAELTGRRGDKPYAIRDEPAVLEFFERAWRDFDQHHQPQTLAASVLGNTTLWDRDLNVIPGLTENLSASLSSILKSGVRVSVTKLIS
jgi:tagaturonate reductase